jgi:hypothetical protein
MIRNALTCLLVASTAGFLAGQNTNSEPRVPKGIYATFQLDYLVNQAQATAYPNTPQDQIPYPNPNVTPEPTDAIILNYLATLLDNPAVSGLAPQFSWQVLNPNSPGKNPANPNANAYLWNPLDDIFTAVDKWNKSHPFSPPKTIKLIGSAGFNAPNFVFNDIDASVCGSHLATSCGSCDGLFESTSPTPVTSQICGYTSIFYATEGGKNTTGVPAQPRQIPLPMPWNQVYKTDHQVFLTALNQRVQQEPSSSAFVAIAMSGPTASSTEMILPSLEDQRVVIEGVPNNGILTLPNDVPTLPNIDAAAAWNILIGKFYGPTSSYVNTDQPFINEWNNAIDLYGQIFTGVTLSLTTTTDALPDFHLAAGVQPPAPATGFADDCDTTGNNTQQQCAAVTEVLAHFTNPTVGGNNAKLVFEAGMTAARDGFDLGTNGVKWLAATSAAGTAPLPGTPYRMSRILGGLQFSHTLSIAADLQAEGCPTYPTTCPNLTPAGGLFNVMQQSFFVGTVAGPLFGASTGVTYGKWVYRNAPMNFVEIYDTDIIYASGLSQCELVEIAGNPGFNVKPDVSTCVLTPPSGGFGSVLLTQAELDLASLGLSLTDEGPAIF